MRKRGSLFYQRIGIYSLLGAIVLVNLLEHRYNPEPETEMVVSQQFREQVAEAYAAVQRCYDYRLTGEGQFQLRLFDAQKKVDSLRAKEKTVAEENRWRVLSNYLRAIEISRMDAQYSEQTKKLVRTQHEDELDAAQITAFKLPD